MSELKPLTFLSQTLVEAGFESPGFQTLHEAAVSGWIPAEEGAKGRWFYDSANLRLIASCLMLRPLAA